MTDKTYLIDEYFKQWEKDVRNAGHMIEDPRYYLEGILVLSCYIGALAAMRYPLLKDGEAYVKVILEYSDSRAFYEQVDLLFLYQWPRSKLRDNGNYASLNNYHEIVSALQQVYGDESKLNVATRYVALSEATRHIEAAAIPGFDSANVGAKLPLFSLAELLYRYVRCDAVHNADFPFVNKGTSADGKETFAPNHAITHKVILDTAHSIVASLRRECVAKAKWPHEL